jgi:hypothetical protein
VDWTEWDAVVLGSRTGGQPRRTGRDDGGGRRVEGWMVVEKGARTRVGERRMVWQVKVIGMERDGCLTVGGRVHTPFGSLGDGADISSITGSGKEGVCGIGCV